jgi:trehalose 6-phosphate synthase
VQLVALANRLPVLRARGGWHPAAGGLVTALRPALEARGGTWVGWDGGAGDTPGRIPELAIDLRPVALSRREIEETYHGFANRTLWPLLHGLVEQPVFERRWWTSYRTVNDRFAEAALAAPTSDDAWYWVHDYHLLLAPAALRRLGARGPVGFFLHVPFPAPEIFARLPWREEVLAGLLGADVVSFHTEEYRENFTRACARLLGVRVVRGVVEHEGRRVRTVAHPISVDARSLGEAARAPGVERRLRALRAQFAGRRVLVGVDRLDYTKGILERLRAIELLLESRPDLRREIAFLQIAVPSRGEVTEYRRLRGEVEAAVGRINGRFTEPGRDVPVHYLHRSVTQEQLLASYRLASACLVTPLRDGMNLVAKEFAVAQGAGGEAGVLVLSEFTGAAEELREALRANPFDVEGLARVIEAALELPEEERRRRTATLAARVRHHDVFWWVDQELGALARVR